VEGSQSRRSLFTVDDVSRCLAIDKALRDRTCQRMLTSRLRQVTGESEGYRKKAHSDEVQAVQLAVTAKKSGYEPIRRIRQVLRRDHITNRCYFILFCAVRNG
jgi:hypothetical protein